MTSGDEARFGGVASRVSAQAGAAGPWSVRDRPGKTHASGGSHRPRVPALAAEHRDGARLSGVVRRQAAPSAIDSVTGWSAFIRERPAPPMPWQQGTVRDGAARTRPRQRRATAIPSPFCIMWVLLRCSGSHRHAAFRRPAVPAQVCTGGAGGTEGPDFRACSAAATRRSSSCRQRSLHAARAMPIPPAPSRPGTLSPTGPPPLIDPTKPDPTGSGPDATRLAVLVTNSTDLELIDPAPPAVKRGPICAAWLAIS
jgi:hypothetical protein